MENQSAARGQCSHRYIYIWYYTCLCSTVDANGSWKCIQFNINAYGFCYQWFWVYQFTCIYVANIDTEYFKCRLEFFVIEFIHEKDGICSLHNTHTYSNIQSERLTCQVISRYKTISILKLFFFYKWLYKQKQCFH